MHLQQHGYTRCYDDILDLSWGEYNIVQLTQETINIQNTAHGCRKVTRFWEKP